MPIFRLQNFDDMTMEIFKHNNLSDDDWVSMIHMYHIICGSDARKEGINRRFGHFPKHSELF